MSALTPTLSASDRARLVRDARAIACGASTGTPTVEHLAALCATVDAVERERDAAVAERALYRTHLGEIITVWCDDQRREAEIEDSIRTACRAIMDGPAITRRCLAARTAARGEVG